MGLSYVEKRMIVGLFLFKIYHNVKDGWTDGRSVKPIPNTVLSIADAR